MKTFYCVRARLPALLGSLLAGVIGCAAQPDRIIVAIDGSRAVVLESSTLGAEGHGPVVLLGALDPLRFIGGIRMALQQTAAQALDLAQLLEAQRDPASADYRRWLTPEEYGERFGLSRNDLNRITAWLESQGFAIQQVARARNWIAFSGNAGQVGRTFRADMHSYRAGGETHFANAAEAWIPAALADVVSELHGLNDFHPKPPRIRRIHPNYTASGGVHYLAPDDLAAIYDIAALYRAGIDGTGQKLAIAGQTDINLTDIEGFRAEFGLAAKDPQLVLYGPDPGVSPDDQIEADLDLEWSGAVARNATIVYVYSQDVFDSVQYAIDDDLAPVISMSYEECETGAPASYRSMAQQANAEGMTWMNSSGDGGAAGCDYDAMAAVHGPAVTFPADIPEVTAVGGTEFNENGTAGWSGQNSGTFQSATGYLPEIAWNDSSSGKGIWATGGGVSVVFVKPWWQTGPGVPNDNARDVPDISLAASADHDGYLIYTGGQTMVVGGTSASSPAFAGIVTLINQYVVAQGIQPVPGLGNINPNLYALAQNTTGLIHDVTAGNNVVPCESGSIGCASGSFGYNAGVGYDLATGLGSVDAFNLVTGWAIGPPAIGTILTLTASAASLAPSATLLLTARITAVTGLAGPAGNVTFAAGGAALGSAAAIVSGTAANITTAILLVKGASLAAGSDSISASYKSTGNFSSSTGSVVVTVTGAPEATTTAVTANPASITALGATQLTAVVTPAGGAAAPSGMVTFSVGSTVLGAGALTAAGGTGTVALSVPGGKLATGGNRISASYAGSGGFTASVSASITVMVAAPAIATTVTLAANPAAIAERATAVLTATVKPASGSAAPTGSVTFTAGSVSLGTVTLSVLGSSAAAALSIRGASLVMGSNTVTASYSGDNLYAASTGTAAITVAAPATVTTTVVAASPPTIPQNAATEVTAMVKPASGNALPAGTISFAVGSTALGSASLTVSGGMAYAVLRVTGSELSLGKNSIVASYSGSASFTASTGSVLVIVTAPAVGAIAERASPMKDAGVTPRVLGRRPAANFGAGAFAWQLPAFSRAACRFAARAPAALSAAEI